MKKINANQKFVFISTPIWKKMVSIIRNNDLMDANKGDEVIIYYVGQWFESRETFIKNF